MLSFNPLLRPIQLPWINSLSVRTLQKDAFLMSVQVGQNSTATMSVSTRHSFGKIFITSLFKKKIFLAEKWLFGIHVQRRSYQYESRNSQ